MTFIYVCVDHKYINNVLNVEAVLAAFNRDKALEGAFSVITNLRMDLRLQIMTRLLAISDLLKLVTPGPLLAVGGAGNGVRRRVELATTNTDTETRTRCCWPRK